MFSMVRIFLVLLLSGVVASAQEQPAASPSPASSPQPSPTATPQPAPSATPEAAPSATPEAAPSATPEAAPSATPETSATESTTPAAGPEATPASASDVPPAPTLDPAPESPAPAPAPEADTIPMEGRPTESAPSVATEGVPLDTQDLSPPLPTGSIPDAAFTDPNAIVPDEIPAPPSMPQAVESAQEKERELQIRYREVRVQADKDPKVLAMFEKSTKAKTVEDKRAALREYYRMLFAKMVSIDKELEAKCRTMEHAYLRRLAQTRLEPTIPLNLPPTPASLNP